MGWHVLEELEHPGGSVRAELEADRTGHYRYRVLRPSDAGPGDADALANNDGWQTVELSGLYEWRGTCRNDARRALCAFARVRPQ